MKLQMLTDDQLLHFIDTTSSRAWLIVAYAEQDRRRAAQMMRDEYRKVRTIEEIEADG